jgi:hypothetical protein
MSQIPLTKLADWTRNKLASKISQAEREKGKLLSEIKKATETLPQYCNQLSKKAEQDMETKRENRAQYKAAKALGRLTELVGEISNSVNVPEETSSVTVRNLQRNLSKAASESARLRADYLRQIRPYYIIDMMTFGGNIDKLRRLSEELHTFLMGHGAILRSLEELDEKMKTVEKLQTSQDATSAQRRSIEQQLSSAQTMEAELRNEMDKVRQNSKMKGYMQIDENLRTLRKELLQTGFSRLGGPLRRLASISERGDYPLPMEVRDAVKEYLTKPFSTFLRETEGYPRLKGVMTALSNAVSSGKLPLKQREAKKVLDRSEQIVSHNSLAKIHEEARRMKTTHDQFLVDEEIASLVKQMRTLKQKGRTSHALQKQLKAELERTIEIERKANEQTSSMVKNIEEFCSNLTEEPVTVQL